MKKRKIQLNRETLRNLGEHRATYAAGGTQASCERACASAESDCRWTCGAYSDCYPTVCYCNSGVASDCTC